MTDAQFASLIAEEEPTWQDYYSKIPSCALARVGTTTADHLNTWACGTTAKTVSLAASYTIDHLNALGQPPPDISDLVTRTVAALVPLKESGAQAACDDPTSAQCDAAETKENGAMYAVNDVLDAWKPYTH